MPSTEKVLKSKSVNPKGANPKSGKRDFASLDDALQANLSSNQKQHIEKSAQSETQLPADVAQKTYIVRVIAHDRILPNPWNPRHFFSRAELVKLADSMLEDGQLQNILVRPHPERPGYFQIVFGERRWRAAGLPEPKYNNLKELECRIGEFDDYQMARLACVENTQRKDVAAIARARGFRSMYDTARETGQARSWTQIAQENGLQTEQGVLRYVRMLDLPSDVQDKMEELDLSEKHGRALLSLKSETEQRRLLREIESEELSGNEAERRARGESTNGESESQKKAKAHENTNPGVSAGARAEGCANGNAGASSGSGGYASSSGAPGGETPGETSRSGLFEIQGSGSSTRSAAEEILNDLREVNSRLGRAATTLEGGTASAGLRHDISREMELIEENLARVKAKV